MRISGSVPSDLGRISPSLNEPKNAVQQAAQKTFLLSRSQLLIAISWPISFSKGKDIANLEELLSSAYRDTFFAPLSIALTKKSFSNLIFSSLILCANFRSER